MTNSLSQLAEIKQRYADRKFLIAPIDRLDELPRYPGCLLFMGRKPNGGLKIIEARAMPDISKVVGSRPMSEWLACSVVHVLFGRLPSYTDFAGLETEMVGELSPPLVLPVVVTTPAELRAVDEFRVLEHDLDGYTEENHPAQMAWGWCLNNAPMLKKNFGLNLTDRTPMMAGLNRALRAAGYDVTNDKQVTGYDGDRLRQYSATLRRNCRPVPSAADAGEPVA